MNRSAARRGPLDSRRGPLLPSRAATGPASWRRGDGAPGRLIGGRVTKARVARRMAMAAAYGGGGLGILSAGAFGLIRAEAALARRAIGEPTGVPPEADGIYGAHHDRRAVADGGARRLERLRARRRPPAPDAGRDAGRRAGRVRRPPGAAGAGGGGRGTQQRPVRPGRADRRQPARPGRRDDRRQRRHPPGEAAGRGPAPGPRGQPAARARRRGRGRHLPGPRHGGAGAAAAALDRPAGQPPARRRPDHRRGRGRRPHRVPRRHPRPGVRGLAVGDVRAGPLPPVGGRLRQRRGRDAALGLRRAGRLDRRPRRSRRPT